MKNELTIFKNGLYWVKEGHVEIEDCTLAIQVEVSDWVYEIIMWGRFEDSQAQMAKILWDNKHQ